MAFIPFEILWHVVEMHFPSSMTMHGVQMWFCSQFTKIILHPPQIKAHVPAALPASPSFSITQVGEGGLAECGLHYGCMHEFKTILLSDSALYPEWKLLNYNRHTLQFLYSELKYSHLN